MIRRAAGTLDSWANRPVSLLRPAAPPYAALPRLGCDIFGLWDWQMTFSNITVEIYGERSCRHAFRFQSISRSRTECRRTRIRNFQCLLYVICFPDMPCMKKVCTEIVTHRYIGQQPGTKSDRRPADKPRINRSSTAGFVLPSVYTGSPLFVLVKKRPSGFSSTVWRVRGRVVSWANQSVGVPSCPSPPRPAVPPCAAPSRPARGMSGFWNRQVGRCLCFFWNRDHCVILWDMNHFCHF